MLLVPLIVICLVFSSQPEPEPVQTTEPTGEEIARSLGYRSAPRGWEDASATDPYILIRRLK